MFRFILAFIFVLGSVAHAKTPTLEIKVKDGNIQIETSDFELTAKDLDILKDQVSKKMARKPKGGTLELKLKGQDVLKLQARLEQVAAIPPGQSNEDLFKDFNVSTQFQWSDKAGKDRVYFGKTFKVDTNEDISELTAIGSNGVILGKVHQLVAVGSNVTLGPGSEVSGKLVSIGSWISRDPLAKINVTEEVSVFSPGKWSWGNFGFAPCSLFCGGFSLLWFILSFALYLAFGAIYLYLLPRLHDNSVSFLRSNKPGSFGLGFLGYLSVIPVIIALVITIIGIVFVPVVTLVVGIFSFFGYLSICSLMGMALPFKSRLNGIKAMAAGLVIFQLVKLIPWLGWFIVLVATTAGFGSVLRSVFLATRGTRESVSL